MQVIPYTDRPTISVNILPHVATSRSSSDVSSPMAVAKP